MDLHLDLRIGPGSLRRRLETALRDAIASGRLSAGQRLPATRALCAQLGVSRGVVVDAYAQLAAEGYLITRRGGGTVVAPTAAMTNMAARSPRRPQLPVRYDLSPFRPALSAFPRAAWARALARAMRDAPDAALGYTDPAGTPRLRAALAAYLARARGVRADPRRVVVTTGTRHGLSVLFAVLVRERGATTVAVEEPGWRGVAETASDAGLLIRAIAVDGEGIVTDGLRGDVVVVAPAHQYPTGAILSPARRARLLAWAEASDAVVVEDDYDAEYRYDRQPVGALQGLAPQRVVYGGSASKTLAPSLRLGWLVLPDALVEPVSETLRVRGALPSALQQLALAELIETGDLDRHLRRQRRRYAAAREALLRELARHGLEAGGSAAGLFAVVHLPAGVPAAAVLAEAAAMGVTLEGAAQTLQLGYANIAEPSIRPAVAAVVEAISRAGRR